MRRAMALTSSVVIRAASLAPNPRRDDGDGRGRHPRHARRLTKRRRANRCEAFDDLAREAGHAAIFERTGNLMMLLGPRARELRVVSLQIAAVLELGFDRRRVDVRSFSI